MRNQLLVLSNVFILLALCVTMSYSETVNLTGTIKNMVTQKGIAGAAVSLSKFPNVTTTTNDNGVYTLEGTVPIKGTFTGPLDVLPPRIVGNELCFSIAENMEQVRVDLYSLSGKCINTAIDQKLYKGDYRVNPFTDRLTDQIYIVRLVTDKKSFTMKMAYIKTFSLTIPFKTEPVAFTRVIGLKTTVDDSLVITATNYRVMKQPISTYIGQNNVSLTRSDIRQGKLSITSVSLKGLGYSRSSGGIDTSVFVEPDVPGGFINSGEPDSLIITLKGILVTTESQLQQYIWHGRQVLALKGNGVLNLSDLYLDSIPKERITRVTLLIDNRAQICGSLTGKFNIDTTGLAFTFQTKTAYTKSAYSYNAASHVGGADSTIGCYAVFENSPAELADIRLSGGEDADTNISPINTIVDLPYDSTITPEFTILFDLSRMLRFYNGCNRTHPGGVNPPDPSNRAYFFCHSVFSNSIASFFGDIGEIQGYQTLYSYIHNGNNDGVPGWMTIICNPAGAILSGILTGDDDNAFTIAKGMIDSVTPGSTSSFHYDISNVDVTEFEKGSALGDTSYIRWHQAQGTDTITNPERFGRARFLLKFKTSM